MKAVLFVIILVAAGLFCIKGFSAPPLRGIATVPFASQPVIVSRARPAVAFVPAPQMRLESRGWRTLRPKTRSNVPGDARLSFAVYGAEDGATLVTAIADCTNDGGTWDPGHHSPYKTLWQKEEQDETRRSRVKHESIYVMPRKQDPFLQEGALEKDEMVLVYRCKYVLQFLTIEAIAEYRTVVDGAKVGEVSLNTPLLESFLEEGRRSCGFVFEVEKDLPGFTALESSDIYSRDRLNQWVGEIRLRDNP